MIEQLLKRFILFAFVLICGLNLHAQAVQRKLTLEDAIEMAKQQSPDALIAKQRFRSSYWQFKNFKGAYLPNVGLSATVPNIYRSISKATNTETQQETFVPQQYSNYIGNLSISQKIGFSGGTIALNTGIQRIDNYYTDSTKTSYLTTPINISLDQPIFMYNPYKWDRKIQPMLYEMAKKKYLEDIEQINLAATTNFFNLLQAQIEKKIAKATLANYDTLYHIAQGRFQLGKIAQNELLTLKLRVLDGRAAVENVAMNLDKNLSLFKSFLRIKDTIPILLVPPEDITFINIDPNQAVELALSNSTKMLEFNQRELKAASNVNKAKMDGRFDARLRAEFGYNGTASTIPLSYKSPLDKEILTLGVTVPLLDWGVARGEIKIAESNQELELNKVDQEKIDFQREVYLKGVQFNMQKNLVMIKALSDTVAKENFEVTKGRYLIGKNVPITELNTAQTDTDAAQRDYYNALNTYWNTYFELRKLTLYDFIRKQPLQFNFNDVKP